MISIFKKYLPAVLLGSMMSTSVAVYAQDIEEPLLADSLVQLAYRRVAEADLLGGSEKINIKDLMEKNHINDLNGTTLKGYIPGYNGGSLWGADTDNGGILVLIDGVIRDMNNIPPTEVESVTFMKGAQAVVLYGARAAKGAIFITTKRGEQGDLRVKAHASTGWAVAKRMPEYLGATNYMLMYNQAQSNIPNGNANYYSDEQIYYTATGANPFRYPDVDLLSGDYVKHTYNRTDADVEISGGNERARYYTNISYYRFGDYLKAGEAKHNYTDRFGVRGNVDVKFSDYVTGYVNTAATFYGARSAIGNYWEAVNTFRPNRVVPFIPVDMINSNSADALQTVMNSNNLMNGMFPGGNAANTTNILGDYFFGGYQKFISRQFQFDAGLNIDLSKVAKGLTFGAMYAIDYATSYYTKYQDEYATFVPTWMSFNGKDEIVAITQEGLDKHDGIQKVDNSASRQTQHFSAQFDYTRTWDALHNFHAMLVGAGWQRSQSGEYHKTSSANLGLGIDYNYDHTYYAEFGSALVHSAKLAPGHRNGLSVSGTVGVNFANIGSLKDNSNVNNLMLSLSASSLKQDMDIENYYMYTATYEDHGWYSWTSNGQAAKAPTRGPNEGLTFITRKEYSASVRGDFFNRALGVNASVLMYDKDGMLINNSTKFPSFFSTYYPDASFVPWLNYDANRTKGFDFGVTGRKKFGEFELELGVNGTYYKTKATKRDEVHNDAYQYAVGRDVDGIWGYRCLGFFETDAEAAAVDQSALGSAHLGAGDLKYEDVNGDGVVNNQDRVFLGRGGWYGDPFTLGINLTAKYKGFTLFVHCTGGYGANGLKSGTYYRPQEECKYSSEVLGCWTPETAATATLPRLRADNAANNNQDSDFWMYSRDRFEIAKVQLTYDFASHLFNGKVVKGVQLFLSADDLLMISKNKKIMETNVGGAPQNRFYNFGATVSF